MLKMYKIVKMRLDIKNKNQKFDILATFFM